MTVTLRCYLETRLASVISDETAAARVTDKTYDLIKFLADCDAIGKAAIVEAQRGEVVAVPTDACGEFALVLYCITHEPQRQRMRLNDKPEVCQKVWQVIEDAVRTYRQATITPADYVWASGAGGIVCPDGSIFGVGKYEDLDVEWLPSVVDYVLNVLDPARIRPFLPPPKAGALTAPYLKALVMNGHSVRIALVGDWGTGPYNAGGYDPATLVMETISALNPDYLIHLGDVYYEGTSVQEMTNFLNSWPKLPAERSFTLNSNHEMYSGAHGYFDRALCRVGAPTPFIHQNGYSYFALTSPALTIVGLDTAYFDDSAMYMEGGLGSPEEDPQYEFLRAAAHRGQLILLTHQRPMSVDGARPARLWEQVALVVPPKKIALWYCGHTHLGIAYASTSSLGGVRAGCTGHGAVPMGFPRSLCGNSNIAWFAHEPVDGAGNRIRNGFAMLTLSDNGDILEEFYDADSTTPVFSRTKL